MLVEKVEKWKDLETKELKTKQHFYPVKAFGDEADRFNKLLHIGKPAIIGAVISDREYEGRYYLDLVIREIELVPSGGKKKKEEPKMNLEMDDDDDDLPF